MDRLTVFPLPYSDDRGWGLGLLAPGGELSGPQITGPTHQQIYRHQPRIFI